MKNIILITVILLTGFLPINSTEAASNYYLGDDLVAPSVPITLAVGATYSEPITGSTVERVSERTTLLPDLPADSMMVYSRFSATNSNGEYVLVHGTDSTSAWVVRLSDNSVVHKVNPGSIGTTEIGENNEIRWDYSGSYPNRIYFVYRTKFFQMDVIAENGNPTELFDIATNYPTASKILNDVEGDSSADSRFWAWQVLGQYDGANYPRIAFVVYDKTANQLIGQLNPGDITPTQNASSWTTKFPKPNMVEISPNGDRVMLNFGRSYTGSPTQDFAGTVLDGPHVFNLDFTNPVKVGITETHSGWGFKDGKQLFVHHMNRTQDNVEDTLQACYTDGTGGIYPNNCFNILKLADYNYLGQHLTRMPSSKPGWILMSTYRKAKVTIARNTAYTAYSGVFHTPDGIHQYYAVVTGTTGNVSPTFPTASVGQTVVDGGVTWFYRGKIILDNQLVMVELKDMAENPRIWRISPTYNEYTGGYRDESSASISLNGNSIFWTANWNDATNGHGEVYKIDLPTDWIEYLTTDTNVSPKIITIHSIVK